MTNLPKISTITRFAQRMTIRVGPLRLEDLVILAPMSGVTDAPFRRLVRRLGGGVVVSEMVASRGVLLQSRESLRRLRNDGVGGRQIVQLAGADPEIMGEAARLNQDLGAEIIDINMGCPAKKVVGKLAGSAIMRDEDLAARILKAVRAAVSIPVTLKMRTGWDLDNRNAPALARIAEDIGIAMITVHGRTRDQGFSGWADRCFISQVKKAVQIPVIANGDIESAADARDMLAKSGADGVMIGRGVYGRPWLIGMVSSALRGAGAGARLPSREARREIVQGHYEAMLEHYGRETGARVARKHLGWYLAREGVAEERRRALMREEAPRRVLAEVAEIYRDLDRWAA